MVRLPSEYRTFVYGICECSQNSAGLRRAQANYAGMPRIQPALTFGNLENTTQLNASLRDVRVFLDRPEALPILLLTGDVGTGKSHILQAMGWALLDEGHTVRYVPVPLWMDELKATFDESSEATFEQVYAPLKESEVLLLDDLGAENSTVWTREQLFKVINYRYENGLRMVLTTNLDYTTMGAQLGPRLTDRLYDTHRVTLAHTGFTSYRTGTQAPDHRAGH